MPRTFEEAKALHEAGRLREAAEAYAAVPDDSPDAPRALNNLGTLYEAEGRFEDAVAAYRKAVTLRADSPVLWYNLGHALHRLDRLPEAILAYVQALQFDPADGATHYNLGNALADQARHESAVGCYRRALECGLDDPRVESRLGTSLLELGRAGEALAAYRRAVEADPAAAEEWYHVGLALEALRRHDEAAESFHRSVELAPEVPAAREALARTLNAAGRADAAILVYRDWLERDPENPVARHMVAALSGEAVPERAGDEYVRTLFDGFAENFDAALARLDYKAPALLADVLRRGAPAEGALDVLDAGCGTGLCGPLLKPYARRLIGVDLSPEMLRRADRRRVYDELHAAELTAFLRGAPDRFDLIVAADTFCYFGDLGPVLAAAAAALRPGGRLLFTLERIAAAPAAAWRLAAHGRYGHSQEYLGAVLATSGLSSEPPEECVLRTEAGAPVPGMVACASKPRS